MLTIIIFIIVLSLLVFVHELGHFFTARKFGIKAEEFGFGFPPRLFGVYKNDQGEWKFVKGSKEVTDCPKTVYSINSIPLGGFVKIKGEDGDSMETDSFNSKKIWQRAVVLAAGVTMNIVLAAILISFGFMIGLPQSLEGLSKNAQVSDKKIQIVQVLKDSPAEKSGIIGGDTILSVDKKIFSDYQSLQTYINDNIGKELSYDIKRGGEVKEIKIKPELRQDTGKGGIGVVLSETGIVKYPWYQAIWEGIKQTAMITWAILVAFVMLIKGLIMGQGAGGDVAGPVGIAKLTGQVAKLGFAYLIQFTALLSVNLAIINFMPIPALDGGRIIFLMIEKIKGRPVKRELEAVIHNIFFLLLIALILFITFKEVWGLFK